MDKWIERFRDDALLKASWSKDPSTKVGAVIFNPRLHTILGSGYNGPPHGFDDGEWQSDRDLKLSVTIHAEINAIIHCAPSIGRACAMMTTHFPCDRCAAFIAAIKRQSSNQLPVITKIYAIYDELGSYEQRWGEMIKVSQKILTAAEIDYECINVSRAA